MLAAQLSIIFLMCLIEIDKYQKNRSKNCNFPFFYNVAVAPFGCFPATHEDSLFIVAVGRYAPDPDTPEDSLFIVAVGRYAPDPDTPAITPVVKKTTAKEIFLWQSGS